MLAVIQSRSVMSAQELSLLPAGTQQRPGEVTRCPQPPPGSARAPSNGHDENPRGQESHREQGRLGQEWARGQCKIPATMCRPYWALGTQVHRAGMISPYKACSQERKKTAIKELWLA